MVRVTNKVTGAVVNVPAEKAKRLGADWAPVEKPKPKDEPKPKK